VPFVHLANQVGDLAEGRSVQVSESLAGVEEARVEGVPERDPASAGVVEQSACGIGREECPLVDGALDLGLPDVFFRAVVHLWRLAVRDCH
jgi:hypothetical protein